MFEGADRVEARHSGEWGAPVIVGLLAAAAGLALVLTGCTALGPTADAVPAGTCLAEYNRYDSDRASIVECTEKHAFDVYATALWPEMAAAT